MRLPYVRFTVRRIAIWVATIAILCVLPFQLSQIFAQDSTRRGALYLERIARMQGELAERNPANAAEHHYWHENYARGAEQLRGQIGWGRLTSLTFVGLAVGFLAWQFRLRWMAASLSIVVMAALLLCSEANQRLPWEVKLGLSFWNDVSMSRSSGFPITFGWTSTDRHIAVVRETVNKDPRMIRVVTAYEVPPKRKKGRP